MAISKIISEVEIPGAARPTEFDETGTVTITQRKCKRSYETELQIGGRSWIIQHVGKHDAEVSFRAMVREYRLRAEWYAKFD